MFLCPYPYWFASISYSWVLMPFFLIFLKIMHDMLSKPINIHSFCLFSVHFCYQRWSRKPMCWWYLHSQQALHEWLSNSGSSQSWFFVSFNWISKSRYFWQRNAPLRLSHLHEKLREYIWFAEAQTASLFCLSILWQEFLSIVALTEARAYSYW